MAPLPQNNPAPREKRSQRGANEDNSDRGRADEGRANAERPDVGDIPARPKSPAVIRFLGTGAEMAGLNTDYFTVGRTDDCDLGLPDELGGDASLVLRFSRGAEGWRLSPSDNQAVFVNQEHVRGLTPLRSGDIIRFAPGAAGMQFNIVHQNATPLANLVARYAPRLLADSSGSVGETLGDDSQAEGLAPLRYQAGSGPSTAAKPAPTTATAAEDQTPSGLDPAVLVAGAILLAGAMLGAAVLYTAPSVTDQPAVGEQGAVDNSVTDLGNDSALETRASDEADAVVPPPATVADRANPNVTESAKASEAPKTSSEPASPAPADDQPIDPVDPEALIDDPFG